MFASEYADRIWNEKYTVRIPDYVTLSDDYIRVWGTPTHENPKYANMMSTNYTTVMLSIIKITHYFIEGYNVLIPSRDDMLKMHRTIEGYLNEWKEYTRNSINQKTDEYKPMLADLERVSKYIYAKATSEEVFADTIKSKPRIGLQNPLMKLRESQISTIPDKPEYEGLSILFKKKPTQSTGRW